MGWDGSACRDECYLDAFGDWAWRQFRCWNLVAEGELIPGRDGDADVINYRIDWDAYRVFRDYGHPDFDPGDDEAFEQPLVLNELRRTMGGAQPYGLIPSGAERPGPDEVDGNQ